MRSAVRIVIVLSTIIFAKSFKRERPTMAPARIVPRGSLIAQAPLQIETRFNRSATVRGGSKKDDVADLVFEDSVIQLNASDFDCDRSSRRQTLRNMKRREWVVDFYAPWCPHCQKFVKPFGSHARRFGNPPTFLFGALNCAKFPKICSAHGAKIYPTIKYFPISDFPLCGNVTSFFNTTTKDKSSSKEIAKWLSRSRGKRTIESTDENRDTVTSWSKTHVREIPVEQQNIAAAIFFAFRHNIFFGSEKLPREDRIALERWLLLLQTNINDAKSAAWFEILRNVVRRQRGSLDHDSWDAAVSRVRIFDLDAASATWTSTCDGAGHGFPCVLWSLFHYLIMQSTDKSALSTLLEIRRFVLHFFRCESCQKHFATLSACLLTSSCGGLKESNSFDRRGAVLWLWKAHNNVTSRVETSAALYPSAASCPLCYDAKREGAWNEFAVFDFLETIYGVAVEETMEVAVLPITRRRRDFMLEEEEEDMDAMVENWNPQGWLLTVVALLVVSLAITSILFAAFRFTSLTEIRMFSDRRRRLDRDSTGFRKDSSVQIERYRGIYERSPLIKRVTSTV